ncbi:MAG: carbon monoxide dehydrogenase [Actinobacteria bacterium]|nr:carbon monoxide dehydrogenase [Actinomycetota bacterium]
MQIEDGFRVELPVQDAWRVLLDIERIAPCLPGAQLQEVEGDEYRGVVKVKVGPITAQYKGTARLAEVDDSAHTAVIVGNGRDTRGQGNASATIKLALLPDGAGTRVTIDTDLSITGKVAQFGRGVMADVSAKLLAQFVDNLERDVLATEVIDLARPGAEAQTGASGESDTEVDLAAVSSVAVGAQPAAEPSGNGAVRRVEHPEAQPVDLLAMGGTSVLKHLAPVIVVVVALVVLRMLVRRRRRRRA